MNMRRVVVEGKEYLSTKEAAVLFGLDESYLDSLCQSEKIDARNIGGKWYLDEPSFIGFWHTDLGNSFGRRETLGSPLLTRALAGMFLAMAITTAAAFLPKSPLINYLPVEQITTLFSSKDRTIDFLQTFLPQTTFASLMSDFNHGWQTTKTAIPWRQGEFSHFVSESIVDTVSIFRYAAHSARSFNLFTQASADRWNNVLLAAVDSFATDGFWSNTLWPHVVRFDAWQSSFGLSLSSFLNWPQVVNRWQSFFRLSPKEEVEKTAPGLELEDDAASLGRLPDQGVLPVDRESLKAEIRQEIFNELKQASWFPPLVVPPAGVVVFPEVGNESQSRLTQDIIGSFSDEVQVQFDEGGRSGVIIPKFKNSFNERYIFILTPIKTGK